MERIVVGIDGSSGSEVALRWALTEAGRHDATVVAVMAWSYLDQHHADHHEGFDVAYGADQAGAALAGTVEAAAPAPSLRVEQRVVCDLPAPALLDAAAGASAGLLVVGARGLGGFQGLLLGSVSERVLEQAGCPVAVVREGEAGTTSGPVVVGVDGSEVASHALRWAAREATARSVALHVVHAWHPPFMAGPVGEELVRASEERAHRILDAALVEPALAGLDTEGHLVRQVAARAMMDLAAGAGEGALVVTGSRGHHRLGRVLLGSTSRQLAHHAPCPVVVVPAPDRA